MPTTPMPLDNLLASADLPGLPSPCAVSARSCEEVLTKEPGRTGDYHWVKVAKTNLGTQQVRAALARSVGITADLVACAGNRDRTGRCVQWFSIAKADLDHHGPLRRAGAHGKMQVLELTEAHKPVTAALVERLRHTVRLRGGARGDGYRKARLIMDRLRQVGCPNYFDPERFGPDASLAQWGRQLVVGERLSHAASGADSGRCKRALQEWLFNRYVATRLSTGTFASGLAGEVIRSRSGDVEKPLDPAHTSRRIASWEAVALGPLFGSDMATAQGEAAALELDILTQAGITREQLEVVAGDRRALRVQPLKATLDPHQDDLSISCELPTDSYINVLIDEFVRAAVPEAAEQGAHEDQQDDA